MTEELFQRDLRAALDHLAPTVAPVSLSVKVGALTTDAPRSAGWLRRLASSAAGMTAVLAVVVVGALVFARAGWDGASPGSGVTTRAFTWETQMARLTADGLTIEAAGRSFEAPDDLVVHSDPGSATYRTLELIWEEQGIEMRLTFYLRADSQSWWIDQIRTFDGRTPGEWIYYLGAPGRTPLGESYLGNVNLYGAGFSGVGRLLIDQMSLTAFEPGTVPPAFDDCRSVGPRQGNLFGPVAQPVHPDMSEFGIAAGHEARDVQSLLLSQGICHEFRLEFPAINRGQLWCSAPLGKVREFAFGSAGQIIVFVEDASRLPLDTELPQVVGC